MRCTSNTTAHSEARLCSMLLTTSQAASCERCSRCRDCCTGGTKAKGGRSIVRFCELRRLVGLLLVGALLVGRLSRLGRHNRVCILGPFAEQSHGSCKLGAIVPFNSAVFVGIPTIERPTIDRLLRLGDIGGYRLQGQRRHRGEQRSRGRHRHTGNRRSASHGQP